MLDELDKKIIAAIQGDIPLRPSPFAEAAEEIGITEEAFVARIRSLKKRGVLRRFGATLRHQEAGFNSNAMVAWLVPEDRVKKTGELLAGFREVTHCYQRMPLKDWPYNLYTMIHGSSKEQCRTIAKRMAQATGIRDYELLFSKKELKKTSMAYF